MKLRVALFSCLLQARRPPCTAGVVAPPAAQWSERAESGVDALLSGFWDTSRQYLTQSIMSNHTSPLENSPALLTYWQYQESVHAVALAAHGNPTKYGQWVQKMVSVQAKIGWSRNWFDDMNWAVLALLEAHKSLPVATVPTNSSGTTTTTYLELAKEVFQRVRVEWDTTHCGGGVWWDAKHTQKATASNAGPALSAALLFGATNDSSLLAWGAQVYRFWNRTMSDPTTGAVTDHLDVSGGPQPPSPPSPPPIHNRSCALLQHC